MEAERTDPLRYMSVCMYTKYTRIATDRDYGEGVGWPIVGRPQACHLGLLFWHREGGGAPGNLGWGGGGVKLGYFNISLFCSQSPVKHFREYIIHTASIV